MSTKKHHPLVINPGPSSLQTQYGVYSKSYLCPCACVSRAVPRQAEKRTLASGFVWHNEYNDTREVSQAVSDL